MLRNQCGAIVAVVVWLIVCGTQMGLTAARSAIYSEESPSSIREEQCHDGCIKKVGFCAAAVHDSLCYY